MFAYVNYAGIHSWKQPVLSNEGKVSCSRKQQGPLLGLNTWWCMPHFAYSCYHVLESLHFYFYKQNQSI